MTRTENLKNKIRALIQSQQLAVISTNHDGIPYASLVAIVVDESLENLFFSTAKTTRKFSNISSNPNVAVLIDNRSNREEDFHEAAAVTVIGSASEISKEKKSDDFNRYLERHPYLKDFVSANSCAFIKIRVSRYIMVERFQSVTELIVE